MSWPALAEHPFVSETDEERINRLNKPPPDLSVFRIPRELMPKNDFLGNVNSSIIQN